MNESDVRLKIIDSQLYASNWQKEYIYTEYKITDGGFVRENKKFKRDKAKRADYLLVYNKIQLAVIEAKSSNYSAEYGMQQAKHYANKLGVPFAYSCNDKNFLEFDSFTGREKLIDIKDFPTPDELYERYLKSYNITKEERKVIDVAYDYIDGRPLRYYQKLAIDKTVSSVAKGQKRILLVMATGTGKTFTTYQIVYKLKKSKIVNKVLYLVDRKVLADQIAKSEFNKLEGFSVIEGRKIESSYQVYVGLYQQLISEEEDYYKRLKPSFFDLIIVDECHRGSANEDSKWREILNYFSDAIQIGITATPKETEDASNIDYFGNPIYTYSLKEGIEDGYLAPFEIIRIGLNIDLEGYIPDIDKKDIYGRELENREYNIKDFDRNLIIDERTKTVAKCITEYLKKTDRFAKTIVFCRDIEHAERMRSALVNENTDIKEHNYIMRMTGEDNLGDNLDNFTSKDNKYPTIATTSKLLTTGVDTVMVKLIVIDTNIDSKIEFKQIIGRGTRIDEPRGKTHFTIMDFRNVSKHFQDPDFDGEPFSIKEIKKIDTNLEVFDDFSDNDDYLEEDKENDIEPKLRINGVDVSVLNNRVQYYNLEGMLVTENIIDFSRKNINKEYATLDSFINAWNGEEKKEAIIKELEVRGVLIEKLREECEIKDIDDFDLICHIAFDKKPLTRAERINNVKKRGYLDRYEGVAREVLEALLDKYRDYGVIEISSLKTLQNAPFNKFGDAIYITSVFGGKSEYLRVIKELQDYIYMA